MARPVGLPVCALASDQKWSLRSTVHTKLSFFSLRAPVKSRVGVLVPTGTEWEVGGGVSIYSNEYGTNGVGGVSFPSEKIALITNFEALDQEIRPRKKVESSEGLAEMKLER